MRRGMLATVVAILRLPETRTPTADDVRRNESDPITPRSRFSEVWTVPDLPAVTTVFCRERSSPVTVRLMSVFQLGQHNPKTKMFS